MTIVFVPVLVAVVTERGHDGGTFIRRSSSVVSAMNTRQKLLIVLLMMLLQGI